MLNVAVNPCGHQQFTVASTEDALHALLSVSPVMHRKGVYIENGIVILSQA